MAVARAKVGKRLAADTETKVALYEGLNMTQIAQAFGVENMEMARRLATIEPAGERNGAPIYRLKDIAPVIWTPTAQQIDDRMKHLHHSLLPKLLSKEYWSGKRSKQEYQIRAAQLWPTSRVVESVGELFKLMRMNLTLMSDAVERQTELTERQRQIIKDQTDNALAELRRSIIEKFSQATEKDLRDGEDEYQVDEFVGNEPRGETEIERINGSDEIESQEL